MKIKNRFKKAVAALMLVTMTAISVCACADKSGSDKSGEPGAVQGNYYLDADKSKQYISLTRTTASDLSDMILKRSQKTLSAI